MAEFQDNTTNNVPEPIDNASALLTGSESNLNSYEWETLRKDIPSDPNSHMVKDLENVNMATMPLHNEIQLLEFNQLEWDVFYAILGDEGLLKYLVNTDSNENNSSSKKKNKTPKEVATNQSNVVLSLSTLTVNYRNKVNNDKKIKSGDKIILNNIFDIAVEDVKSSIGTIKKENKKDIFTIDTNIILNTSRTFKCPIFTIILWVINLHRYIKKNFDINNKSNILNAIISITRMREEISHFPDSILENMDYLIDEFTKRAMKHFSQNKDEAFIRMLNFYFEENEHLLIKSNWELIKNERKELYSEQKEVLRLFREALNNENNQPLFLTYKVSPGSGKTFLSAVLAQYLKQNTGKMLLYACYNPTVRLMVAKLCIDADIPFMFASSITNNNVSKTYIRPPKSMFNNYRERVSDELHKMKFGTLDEQWLYYGERLHTLPVIVIADLESCSDLLDNSPERFIGYFDEVTAGAEEGIDSEFATLMCKVLLKAPRQSILLSATVQDLNQLNWCIESFVEYHSAPLVYTERVYDLPVIEKNKQNRNILDILSQKYSTSTNKFELIDLKNLRSNNNTPIIETVQSSRLNISCTAFVPNEKGEYMSYMPHMRLNSINELQSFVNQIEKDTALVRFYSPEAVYYMVMNNNSLIPDQFKFEIYFKQIGLIRHNTIRNYIVELFKFILETNNEELLLAIRNYSRPLLSNEDRRNGVVVSQDKILDTNAFMYSDGKVIQVLSQNRLNGHVNLISDQLLHNVPSFQSILNNYAEQERIRDEKINSVKPMNGDTKMSIERNIQQIKSQYAPKINYPPEYLINSNQHRNRFAPHASVSGNCGVCLSKEDIVEYIDHHVDERRIYLAMTGVAVRNSADMSNFEKNMYEKNIVCSNFVISDPSIVYGTNIKNVTTVSVTVEYAASPLSTRNSIYQLMGRAGRLGQSNSARIIFHSREGIEKLYGDVNYEANIMIQIAERLRQNP